MREARCTAQARRKCHELWANPGNQVSNLDDIRIFQSGDVARVDRSADDLDRYAVLGLLFRRTGHSADLSGAAAISL